jgi:chlorobactene glucosyltransferase
MPDYVSIAFAWSVAAIWGAGFAWFFVKGRTQPTLSLRRSSEMPTQKVSVIVPARNEADRVLKKSIASLLEQNYDVLEVIVVDDRSTDETLQLLKELSDSRCGGRLTIVEGRDLPNDWLGKPHALQQGYEVATGELILTTDADIIFNPDAIRTAVSYMSENNIDALSLVPRLELETFWERVFMPVFGWFCLLAMPLYRVNDPNRKETIGVGNFFLLSRDSIETIGGFGAVKSDVAEDLRLAELVKQNGLRLRVETAPELIWTRMYSGVGEIWEGFTKNLFSALKFSVLKGIAGVASIFLFGCMPLVMSILYALSGEIQTATAWLLGYLFQVAIFIAIVKNIEQNPVYAFFIPAGFALYAAILLNSMLKIISGKGVTWKGRDIYEKGGIKPPQK